MRSQIKFFFKECLKGIIVAALILLISELVLFFVFPGLTEKFPFQLVRSPDSCNYYYKIESSKKIEDGVQLLDRKKDKRELRIVVFGESSAAGYPDHETARASFLRFLQAGLSEIAPDQKITYINMGRPGNYSVAMYEDVYHIISYSPDIFIFYAGFNEHVGAVLNLFWCDRYEDVGFSSLAFLPDQLF